MGMRLFKVSTSTYDTPKVPKVSKRLPNPDPENFKILRSEQIGEYLIVLLLYPDCTNFEGKKICVYKNVSITELVKRKDIDPHFTNNKSVPAPVARFIPTDEGWEMAKKLCACM